MFEVVTEYDKKALLAMNRAINRTTGRRRYLFHKIFKIVLGVWWPAAARKYRAYGRP